MQELPPLEDVTIGGRTIEIPEPPDQAALDARDSQLVSLAEALGVSPVEDTRVHAVLLITQDGRGYSWTDLVEAHIALLKDVGLVAK